MPNGNSAVVSFLRSSLGRRLAGTTVTISYTGPKSGKHIELPVWAARDGERFLVAVGWPDKKQWHKAFRTPLEATVTRKGTSYEMVGHLATPEEHTDAMGVYRTQLRRAQRTVKGTEPVVIFEPRPTAG